jgi:diacylglycerol kinase (ATP)
VSPVSKSLLAIVNPAAGGGRCGRLVKTALARLRDAGIELETAETSGPGDATRLARAAYAQGQRRFLAVGGDGTAFEIVNGVFPAAWSNTASCNDAPAPYGTRPTLGFMPLGTGNSFLRDFSDRGVEYAAEAIISGRHQACDVVRLTHAEGEVYFINLLTMGFTADVTAAANRRFKGLGELGYILGVLVCLWRLDRRSFPLRMDEQTEIDRRRCLFLSFSNSKFTGGKMLIAPQASTNDGLVECVRWGPIGRLGLLRNFPKLFDGTHLAHPEASRCSARSVEFVLDAPIDVMVDGEVLTLDCRRIDVLPGALDVMV